MKQAGVNTVALAIFSWAKIQPTEDRWISAGSTASSTNSAMPASRSTWPPRRRPRRCGSPRPPEVLPRRTTSATPSTPARANRGARPARCSSEYALNLCRKLAERYGTNPYVTAWHMGNEYGWNNREDYSDNALDAFRAWCRRNVRHHRRAERRVGHDLLGPENERLRRECSSHGSSATATSCNPGKKLDFERFGSDMSSNVLHSRTRNACPDHPRQPLTTNFMVSSDQFAAWTTTHWRDEVELRIQRPLLHSEAKPTSTSSPAPTLSWIRSRSASRGTSWNTPPRRRKWSPANTRKRKGETVRDSLAHAAMGADAINFYGASRSVPNRSIRPWFRTPARTRSCSAKCASWAHRCTRSPTPACRVPNWRTPDTAILFSAESEWATRSRETLPSMKLYHWHDVP